MVRRKALRLDSLRIGIDLDSLAVPRLRKDHFVHSERASLIRADVVGPAHCLTGLHPAYQVLIIKHLLNREGEREGNGKGKALRNGHNDHCDANNEVVKNFDDICSCVPLFRIALDNGEAQEKDSDDEDSRIKTESSDIVGEILQFLLQWCLLFLVLLQQSSDLAEAGLSADHCYHHPALSREHSSSAHHHR